MVVNSAKANFTIFESKNREAVGLSMTNSDISPLYFFSGAEYVDPDTGWKVVASTGSLQIDCKNKVIRLSVGKPSSYCEVSVKDQEIVEDFTVAEQISLMLENWSENEWLLFAPKYTREMLITSDIQSGFTVSVYERETHSDEDFIVINLPMPYDQLVNLHADKKVASMYGSAALSSRVKSVIEKFTEGQDIISVDCFVAIRAKREDSIKAARNLVAQLTALADDLYDNWDLTYIVYPRTDLNVE